jgi:zinc/manganese transport system permease protein
MDAWPWFAMPLLALAAGIAALAPLGVQVVARGVVFIDLAVAQGAAAAALWMATSMHAPTPLAIRLAAVAGGVAVAALVAAFVRRRPAEREALIGLVYVIGAALATLGASADPHGRERLAELLAADILWVDASQVALLGTLAVGVALLGRAMRGRRWPDALFYPTFAVFASLAVPALGLFIVFAALIVPALWQRIGVPWWGAVAAATAAAGTGLAVSWAFDRPSGACVAIGLGACGAAVAFVRDRRGDRPSAP